MTEKENKYPQLILFEDGTYEFYEKEGVELKFKEGKLLKEFINNPNLKIIIFGFPDKMII